MQAAWQAGARPVARRPWRTVCEDSSLVHKAVCRVQRLSRPAGRTERSRLPERNGRASWPQCRRAKTPPVAGGVGSPVKAWRDEIDLDTWTTDSACPSSGPLNQGGQRHRYTDDERDRRPASLEWSTAPSVLARHDQVSAGWLYVPPGPLRDRESRVVAWLWPRLADRVAAESQQMSARWAHAGRVTGTSRMRRMLSPLRRFDHGHHARRPRLWVRVPWSHSVSRSTAAPATGRPFGNHYRHSSRRSTGRRWSLPDIVRDCPISLTWSV